MKHSYSTDCPCPRCTRERGRRARQGDRTIAEVMTDWQTAGRRRRRVAREYWEAYESGRPMSSEDY